MFLEAVATIIRSSILWTDGSRPAANSLFASSLLVPLHWPVRPKRHGRSFAALLNWKRISRFRLFHEFGFARPLVDALFQGASALGFPHRRLPRRPLQHRPLILDFLIHSGRQEVNKGPDMQR